VPGEAGPANTLIWGARWVGIAGYLGVTAIVVLSLVPGEWRPSLGLAKAIEHAIAYAIVGFLVTTPGHAKWRPVVILIVLAGVLELGQVWIPGRNANLVDFLASSAAALFGAMGRTFVLARVPRLSGSA
jgi:hypothetical protein